jgi:hypothetical protein
MSHEPEARVIHMGKSTYNVYFHRVQRGHLGSKDKQEKKEALDSMRKARGNKAKTNERLWWTWKSEKV